MTKDYTQLAIENGARVVFSVEGEPEKDMLSISRAALNATVEAAIKQAFDELACSNKADITGTELSIKEKAKILRRGLTVTKDDFIQIAKRGDK